MLSDVELDYVLSLINTYQKQGYKYYLVNTITNSSTFYDIDIYVSKKEIKAITQTTFDLTNAIHLRVDSSPRNDNQYNQSLHARVNCLNKSLSSVVSIDEAEFIYTNAIVTGSNISIVNPDILLNGSDSYSNISLVAMGVVLVCTIFLYMFFTSILRIRK